MYEEASLPCLLSPTLLSYLIISLMCVNCHTQPLPHYMMTSLAFIFSSLFNRHHWPPLHHTHMYMYMYIPLLPLQVTSYYRVCVLTVNQGWQSFIRFHDFLSAVITHQFHCTLYIHVHVHVQMYMYLGTTTLLLLYLSH